MENSLLFLCFLGAQYAWSQSWNQVREMDTLCTLPTLTTQTRPNSDNSSQPSFLIPWSYSVFSQQNETEKLTDLMCFLLKQTSIEHIYIIYDDDFEGIRPIARASITSWADAVLLQYRVAVQDLSVVLKGGQDKEPVRHLLLFCSANHTVVIFKKVRSLSLGSARLKWIVTAVEDISTSLQEALSEGTQVLLVIQKPSNFRLLVSYVNQNNEIRFKKSGTWSLSRRSSFFESHLFPDVLEIYGDFQGRELVVATIDNWPFFQLRQLPNGTLLPNQGIDYNVLNSISHYLNFTYRIVQPQDGKWGGPRPDGTVYGMVGMVAQSEAHVAIDEITITEGRETVVDFTQPYFLESTTLVSRAPEERARSLAVFKCFTFPLWILLILLTLAMGPLALLITLGHDHCSQVVHTLIQRNEHEKAGASQPFANKRLTSMDSIKLKNTSPATTTISFLHNSTSTISWYCFNMFRSVLIQGNRLTAESWPMRLLLFTWYTFCVILYALYAGTLTAYLTKPSFEKPIDSLQDLVEASKYGFVPAAQAGTSNENLLKMADSGIFKALWKLTDPKRSFPMSGYEAMDKVLTNGIVYMSASLNSEIRASQKGRDRFHLARNTFFPQGYGIACFPGAPFIRKFSIMLGRMNQAGLVNKWVQDEIRKLRSNSGPNRKDRNFNLKKVAVSPLSLDHLQGGFFVLMVGVLFSGICLVLETLMGVM